MAKRRARRTFNDKFKRDLIAQIEDGARVTDLAKKHKIQASQISLWKKKYGGGSADAPAPTGRKRGRPPGSKNKTTISAPGAAPAAKAAPAASTGGNTRIAELERMIGQLVVENAKLKGNL